MSVDTLKLYATPSEWENAPELPLAKDDPENIIGFMSLWAWADQLKELEQRSRFDSLRKFLPEKGILYREIFAQYYRLRFLSRAKTKMALDVVATDIKDSFNPEKSLIMVDGFSSMMFYRYIENKIPEFGSVKSRSASSNELDFIQKGSYVGINPIEADKLVLIDDWVLSGEQFSNSVALLRSRDQLYTYHMVMSDKGRQLYDRNGLHGKTVFRLDGDDGPEAFFGTYPVYGFHKIPDRISDVYAPSAKHYEPSYSIFPRIDGYLPGGHTRLSLEV